MTRFQEFTLGFMLLLTGATFFAVNKILEKVTDISPSTPIPIVLLFIAAVVMSVVVMIHSLAKRS